jgi:phytanoyl-CoA hydroxylase
MAGLDPDQIAHYREQGYVVVPSVLDDAEIQRFRGRAREIALGDLPDEAANRRVLDIEYAKRLRPMPEDPEHAIWKIMNPDRFDSVFRDALRIPKVLDAVESLLGRDLLAFLLMFIYKPPGLEGSVHPFHQDAVYFPFTPQDLCCGVWIPLDRVNEANGTLCVVPGSHTTGIRPHQMLEGINFGALAAQGVEDDERCHAEAVALELEPGDCLLFHTRLFHRSGGNRTQDHRRVITLHMASARCQPNGAQFSEFGFTSVRGQTFDGCLQPVVEPDLKLQTRLV